MVNNVYELPSTKQIIQFHHATAGFSTKAMWLKAIKAGFYATWLMLTAITVIKYFPESEETQKGHMQQNRQGIQSTKKRLNAKTHTWSIHHNRD